MPVNISGSGATGSINTAILPSSGTFATQSYADTAGGLVKIANEAFSAVSSVSVNNCFTSTYENYRILLLTTVNGADDVYMRLRANGTDTSTNYNRQVMVADSTSVVGNRQTAQTSIYFLRTSNSTFRQSATMDIFGPQIAGVTTYSTTFANHQSAITPYVGVTVGNQSDSTQFDGFSLISSTNFTGIIRVYGYRN